MQSLTLIRAAMLGAAFLTGCGTDLGPTAESAVGEAAAATDRNAVDHTKYTFAISETNINPCNGELVQLAGTIVGQSHLVGPRGSLDNGAKLHEEIHEVVSETGTGLTTGVRTACTRRSSWASTRRAFPHPRPTFMSGRRSG